MVSSIFSLAVHEVLILFLWLLLCSLPWVVLHFFRLLRMAGSGYPLFLGSYLIKDCPLVEDGMAAVVRRSYAFLALLSWQWRNLSLRSWGSCTGDPIGGLVYVGGIFDAIVGSLVGWKWSAVVLVIDGDDKTCVAAMVVGFLFFWALGLVFVWAFLLGQLLFIIFIEFVDSPSA